MQDRSPITRRNLLATHGRTIHKCQSRPSARGGPVEDSGGRRPTRSPGLRCSGRFPRTRLQDRARCRQVRRIARRMAERTARPPPRRVAAFLIELAKVFGRRDPLHQLANAFPQEFLFRGIFEVHRRNRKGHGHLKSSRPHNPVIARPSNRRALRPKPPWRSRRRAQALQIAGLRSGYFQAASTRSRIAATARADRGRCI